MGKSQTDRRILGLDGVRALSCLWVFLSHLYLIDEDWYEATTFTGKTFIHQGFMGVAIFFVLSGFLLSQPFWRKHATHDGPQTQPNLRSYTRRRVARIIPGYLAALLLPAIINGIIAKTWVIKSVALSVVFANQFLPITYQPDWNRPLWSISIEMTFYVFLPLCWWLVLRVRSRGGAWAMIVGLMTVIAVGHWVFLSYAPAIETAVGDLTLFNSTNQSTLFPAHVAFTHFLWGVLAADLHLHLPRRDDQRGLYDIISAVLVALMFVLPSTLEMKGIPALHHIKYAWPTYPMLVAAILFCLPRSNLTGRLLDNAFLKLTAKWSFGIYIWQYPVLLWAGSFWVDRLGSRPLEVAVSGATGLVVCYAIAGASYQWLELPFIKRFR
ncbi:MAG: acyltransferase family protein [Bradymonadia bacterium]